MNLQQVQTTPAKRQWFIAIVAPLFIAALLWAGNGMAMHIEQSVEAATPLIACTGPCSDPGGGG